MAKLGSLVLGADRLGEDSPIVKKWQDIQIPDRNLWSQIHSLWKNGNYAQAISILQNIQLVDKWNDANKINQLTSKIVYLEKLDDPSFKKGIPITSEYPPANINLNQVWFDTGDGAVPDDVLDNFVLDISGLY